MTGIVNAGQLFHFCTWHQLRDKFKYVLLPHRTSVSLWTRSPIVEPTHMLKTVCLRAFGLHFPPSYPKSAMFNLFFIINGSVSVRFLVLEIKLGSLSNEDDLRELLSQTLPYSKDMPVFIAHPK